MSTNSPPAETPMWMVFIGWIVSLLPALGLLLSACMKLMTPAQIAEVFEHLQKEAPDLAKGFAHLQWHESMALGLGILELGCALAYLIPRTAVFGAILTTGYLGGAIATHVRIGDPFVEGALAPLVLGFLIWLGLVLRDENVRAVLPLRSPIDGSSWFVWLLFLLVAVAVGVAAVVALQPSEYKVERSITINAPAADIFPHVDDFHKWDAWSPWLKIDPNAKISYEGPKAGKDAIFRWEGNSEAGQGSMTIVESQPDHIKIKLEFLKPMAGTAETDFTFKEENNKTVVTWKMHGQNDIVGKAFCLVFNMNKIIGDKYDEGLASLKKVVEEKK
jgi:Polyketide cyclase / dehydrase and lipid transport/DoxX-like family